MVLVVINHGQNFSIARDNQQSNSLKLPQRIRWCPVPLTSKGKEMSMKSSHQIHLEMIEQTLQPVSCFQLQAA
jgi:hypothetical protein